MKKFFNETIKFLINLVLILCMMTGAHQVIDLPIGWAFIGYLLMFAAGLTAWTLFNTNTELFYNEGYTAGWKAKEINEKIHEEINKGEKDEFDIEMENEHATQYIILAGKRVGLCSNDEEYKYHITSIENLGETSKITFTKEKKEEQKEE